jgi:hypothetical protein
MGQAINATFSLNLSFDVAKNLAPIVQLGSILNLLVVNPSLGVTSVLFGPVTIVNPHVDAGKLRAGPGHGNPGWKSEHVRESYRC